MTLIDSEMKPSSSDESVETHRFTVSPNIITHLIKSQAGTIGKGILEAIANAVDSGSTRVDITVTADKLIIADNGCGIQTRAEIL